MENKRTLSYNEMMEMPSKELFDYIEQNYMLRIPPSIESVEDMMEASKILSQANAYYSYFTNKALATKITKRNMKRNKASKEDIEDILSKEEIFANAADLSKAAYNTISRMITVKQQINYELKMAESM